MIVSNKHKFVFTAIPKTGTRSVYDLCIKRYEFHKLQEHLNVVPKNFEHYKKFTIVRNPYDRFISLWWSTCMRSSSQKSKNSAGMSIKNALQGKTTPHDLLEYMMHYEKSDNGPGRLFSTQYDYLKHTRFDYILHTENLSREIYNIPFVDPDIEMPVINSSKVVWGHNVKSRKENHWEYIDQRLLVMINEYYKNDFEILSEYEKLDKIP